MKINYNSGNFYLAMLGLVTIGAGLIIGGGLGHIHAFSVPLITSGTAAFLSGLILTIKRASVIKKSSEEASDKGMCVKNLEKMVTHAFHRLSKERQQILSEQNPRIWGELSKK